MTTLDQLVDGIGFSFLAGVVLIIAWQSSFVFTAVFGLLGLVYGIVEL